jgi:hypothetical protein
MSVFSDDLQIYEYLRIGTNSFLPCNFYRTAANCTYYKLKRTLWPLVRKRTIPTERPPLVDEILCQLLWIEGCRVVSAADPLLSLISVF